MNGEIFRIKNLLEELLRQTNYLIRCNEEKPYYTSYPVNRITKAAYFDAISEVINSKEMWLPDRLS